MAIHISAKLQLPLVNLSYLDIDRVSVSMCLKIIFLQKGQTKTQYRDESVK